MSSEQPPRNHPAPTPDEIARQLEHSSIEDVLRMQDQLAQLMRDKYEKRLAVMFSDIAGSTAYFEKHGDAAGRRMIQRHNDLLIPLIQHFGGRVVKTIGDALMATFPSAQSAVDAAVSMQRAVNGSNARATHDGDRLDIRIGLNFGTALVNDKDGDVYGDMVNVAARVQAQADRRQILISQTVREALTSPTHCHPAGTFTLKGKSQEFELYEVTWAAAPAVTAPTDGMPRLDARYTLLGPLGQGGMAQVYRARDEHLGRDVAIKVVHPHLPMTPGGRERFRREAQVAAALAHDNIVQTYDFGSGEGKSSYIALELIEGESLRAFAERRGRLPGPVVALLGHELARALAYAHQKGVIHRDVKPDNVLISARGAVKLGDFGIAMVQELARLTADISSPLGTPGFVPPEQLRGEPVSPRTDLFALGVLMYELATARSPFPGETPQQVLYQVLEGTPVPAREAGEVDPELSELIAHCMAKDPAARPQDAGSVADALARYLQSYGVGDPRAALAGFFSEGVLPVRAQAPDAAASAGAVPAANLVSLPTGDLAAYAPISERGSFPSTTPIPLVQQASRRRFAMPIAVGAVVLIGISGAVVSLRPSPQHPAVGSPDASAVGSAVAATARDVAAAAPARDSEGSSSPASAAAPARDSGGSSSLASAAAPAPAASDAADKTVATSRPAAPTSNLARGESTQPPAADAPSASAAGAIPTARAKTRPNRSNPRTQSPAASAQTAAGTLRVVLTRGWAEIHVDGVYMGTAPQVTALELPAGKHQLRLLNKYRAPYEQTVTVAAGRTVEIRAELEPLP